MDEDVDKALKEITPEEFLSVSLPGNDEHTRVGNSRRRAHITQ